MRLIDEGIEMPAEPSKHFGDTFSGQLRIRRRAASTAIIDKGICIATTYTKDGNQSPIKQSEDAVNVAQWLCKSVNEYSEMSSQLAALKEESERLKDELAERQKYILSLEARVEELEKSSISRTLLVTRLQEIPDAREMNLHDAEIIWSILEEVNEGNFDFKEPANEG